MRVWAKIEGGRVIEQRISEAPVEGFEETTDMDVTVGDEWDEVAKQAKPRALTNRELQVLVKKLVQFNDLQIPPEVVAYLQRIRDV